MMLMMMKEKKKTIMMVDDEKKKRSIMNRYVCKQVLCTGKEKPIKGGLEVQKMPHEGNNYIYFERSIN